MRVHNVINIKKSMIAACAVLFTFLILLLGTQAADAATIKEGESISVNTTINAQQSEDEDEVWYSFTLTEAGYVSLDISFTEYDDDDDVEYEYYLYNADGDSIYSMYPGSDSGSDQNIGLDAGTFYIKISADVYTDISYTVKVNFTSSSVWEREPNNDIDEATKVNINTTYYGSNVYTEEKPDWFKFTLSSAGTVTIAFDYTGQSSRSEWQAYLYDANEDIISYIGQYTDDGNLKYYKVGLSAGTYYFRVYGEYADGYHFKVNYTASNNWETESNNNFSTATTIKTGTTYYGNQIVYSGDDYYKVNVSYMKNAAVMLTIPTYTGNLEYVDTETDYWQVQIYDANHNEVSGGYQIIPYNSRYNILKTTLSQGTYYIRISCEYTESNAYKLRVTTYKKATTLAKTSLKSVKGKSKAIKVTWKKKQNIDGYEVRYSTNKKFKKAKSVKISSGLKSTTLKKLKAKKKYYVKVRTYKTVRVNGSNVKIYSSWSKVKSVKTKK